jgi:hypothetical protein
MATVVSFEGEDAPSDDERSHAGSMTALNCAVAEYLAGVEPPKRRRDAELLLGLMQRATHEPPWLYLTSIIGFGRYEVRYANGRVGEAPAASFSPRKRATSIYLANVGAYESELRQLGPHRTSRWCLYIANLTLVRLDVLQNIVRTDYRTLIARR